MPRHVSPLLHAESPSRHFSKPRLQQQGFSLVELMVGMAVGLLVMAAASVALLASRSLSATVSDASYLQQQASYALRIIGLQLRQAGGLYLNLNLSAGVDASLNSALAPATFETAAPAVGSARGYAPQTDILRGSHNSLQTGHRRYKEPVFAQSGLAAQARNCLGGPVDASADQRLESHFRLRGHVLRCGGNDTAASPQPLVENVAAFRLRYLRMQATGTAQPQLQYVNVQQAGRDWSEVVAVEVCLVLFGQQAGALPAGSGYSGCDGEWVQVADLTGPRKGRMHRVFRNLFQLRSQGSL
ncbi:PilW family protein [Comamonas sp. JUb58]|uniref:PilW family protein n=1 Tax=Comamonas sp. JUb58 TaxID=2485114 RepID=UPI0010609246|nr:PilW family protein [Comamonas sp. JUb58]TDS84098.1 type IV pilus assembly protein PilW [Comamonas sp. JUb58]